jgi:hypothetical protein
LHGIGRPFGKSDVSIHFLLSRHGGIVPAARRRSLATLTLGEREDISRGIASGHNTYIALVWLRLGNLVHVRNRASGLTGEGYLVPLTDVSSCWELVSVGGPWRSARNFGSAFGYFSCRN